MKSSIKFDIDENGKAFLSLKIVNDFEDLRDKAANAFVQSFHGGEKDVELKCVHTTNADGNNISFWEIRPIMKEPVQRQ